MRIHVAFRLRSVSGQSGELDSKSHVLVTFDLQKKAGKFTIRVSHRIWMKFDGIQISSFGNQSTSPSEAKSNHHPHRKNSQHHVAVCSRSPVSSSRCRKCCTYCLKSHSNGRSVVACRPLPFCSKRRRIVQSLPGDTKL